MTSVTGAGPADRHRLGCGFRALPLSMAAVPDAETETDAASWR